MREAMADLFALLQDLGDRIANKVDCTSSTQHDEDDAVESRFRAVLPALLDRSFAPMKGREREMMAIIKLLCMMVKYFPGVFHHGKGHSILPILRRIIPLFAKSELRACHEGLLETWSAFMLLLKTGDHVIYQQMFADGIILIDDLASIASFYSSERSFTPETKMSIQCYGRSYSALSETKGDGWEPRPCGDRQVYSGIVVSVSGEASWQSLAEWTIKLLGRCLQEGAVYLEGLLTASVISRVAILFCYGQSILQMACFEFIHIASSLMDMESFPTEKLIMLLITILSFSGSDLLPFSGAFDSALGACLFSLCSVCQRGTLECVAQAFINVMPQTVKRTSSQDLKVVMLEVSALILKQCPSLALDFTSTLEIIRLSGVGSSLASSAQLAVKLPEPAKVAVEVTGFGTTGTARKKFEAVEAPRTSSTLENSGLLFETERTEKHQSRPAKRQRLDTRRDSTSGILPDLGGQSTAELAVKDPSRDHMQTVDLPIGEMIHPPRKDASIVLTSAVHKPQQEVLRLFRELTPQSNTMSTSLIDEKLAGLSVLIQWFGGVPETVSYRHLVQLFDHWLSWTYKKVQEGSLTRLHTFKFLEAMEKMLEHDRESAARYGRMTLIGAELLKTGTGAGNHGRSSILQLSLLGTSEHLRLVQSILLHPWSSQVSSQESLSTKLKCRAIRIASIIGGATEESNLELVVKQALQDEEKQVRAAALTVIPNFINHASSEMILELYALVSSFAKDTAEQVREAVPATLGLMSCIYYATFAKEPSQEKQILGRQFAYGKAKQPNFVCNWCDCGEYILSSSTTERGPVGMKDDSVACPLFLWQPLFSELLFEGSSERVQVSFIGCMSRVLRHATTDQIGMIRKDWLECLDVLTLHRHRSVREAFCSQIKVFTESHVLAGVFGLVADSETNQELQMLGKLKHALCISQDPDVLDTLIETIAKVATFSCHRRQLFFFSLVLLLEQLDNKDLSLRCKSVLLIRETISMSFEKAESHRLPSMVDSIRDELYEYLINRLLSRPLMIQEFSEAVLGIKFVAFLKRMVPVILPKLVLGQQHSQQALDTLHELARTLNTDLPLLLLEWCHKVLSVLLLRADGMELMAALQFYEAQTGSDPREIFAAVLPALLDELVRFLGDTDNEEAQQRSARVAPMMQEVARIVTGSDDLPAFLKGHFVGLLNSIDRKLLRAEDVISQKQALRCIGRLVEMIGTHLSAFVPKILALLTRALQDARLRIAGLKVWLSFVHTLIRTAPASAKSVASQVVVALMPFLEESEDEQNAVVEVFEELFVTSGAFLGDQAKELPILPSLPALESVNAVLHEARGSLSLRDRLHQAVDGLHHESMSVRYMTGNELRRIMQSQRTNITAMLAGESAADIYVISKLVTVLLRGFGEESRTAVSQKFKMACAECLGELGAVDPAKLQVDLRRQSRIERSNEDLIFDLINEHLARVLRAATDTDIQDAAALAIQELLKLSGSQAALLGRVPQTTGDPEVSKDASSSMPKALARRRDETNALAESGEQLWRRFSDDVKEIITPCLTSKYFLRKSSGSISAGTIYQPGISFRRWIYLWIRRLISQSSGRRAEIFVACTSVVRHDMETALYLLPYLVLGVVCDGSIEARDSVKEEILAVLAQASSMASKSATCLGSRQEAKLIRRVPGPNEVSTQTVFSLIDTLGQWLDDCKLSAMNHSLQPSAGSSRCTSIENGEVKVAFGQVASHRHNVLQLLAAIPKEALAGASFRCRAYARALQYFETHVREKSGALSASLTSGVFVDEDVTFLLEIYNELDEPDGLAGLSRLRMSTSLQDQILINEKAGKWGEALTCCEQALQMEPASVTQHSHVLDCLLNMGHLQAMVTHVDGLVSRLPEHKSDWSMHGIQAAWRLGQWDLLEEYVRGTDGDGPSPNGDEDNAAFDISLSRILQGLQKRDLNLFTEQIMQSRQALLAPLAAASMESYTRAYPFIVKLHMLQELEDFSSLATEALNEEVDNSQLRVSMTKTVEHWESRLKITQPSLCTREPILALRRLILSANELRSEVGICWLQYAKLCRAAGHYETANRAILQAQSEGAPNAQIEMAKLLWDTKRSHRAIAELQQGLSNVSHSVRSSALNPALNGLSNIDEQLPVRQGLQDRAKKRLGSELTKIPSQARRDKDVETAKALLLLARWVHHTGQLQKDEVVSLYSQVKELQPKWEKGWFFMAKYFDDLLVDARRRQEENSEAGPHSGAQKRNLTTSDKLGWDYLPDVLLFYAKGLHKGHRHLFQAMPRLLTLWFEFGSCFHGDLLASNRGLRGVHSRVMGIVRGCLKDLPTYQWLTSLSQLVSRICHQNVEVVRIVKHVISSVLQAYPQQALWMMAAVTKSVVAVRQEAAAEIINQARNALGQKREKMVLFTQFASLIDQMIRLCNFSGQPRAKLISLASEFSYLKRLMPVGVIMPLQRALFVTLPANGLTDMDYNPFPAAEFSTISGIADEIEILASLQKPKKVVLLGSDGVEHPFLCKPKDDLRKDARMMEFTTMINRLLSKDPDSRRRKLYIRTFAVVPLSEDCGMIEWVLHTRGLRHILQDLYVACGKFDRQKTNPAIKRIYDEQQAQKGAEKLSEVEMLQTKVLPMFPPVLHRWFLNLFPEPAAWFQARVAYAHTTAVWSMVGHIVGLGDRHGENILFDSTTGDCVHVDFSCLFDKGLQLEKPELVPFRLTHNMVDGLGITGYEGVFLRVCEITLNVLRSHRETLMSVLETFLHDPLVEWTKSHKSSCVEVQNPHAQKAIANIVARLEGVVVGVAAAPSLPLSVEGQAHRLIAEAVSHQNLSKMYIWWMPWF